MDELFLTGGDHLEYGELATRAVGGLAAAMSIGATADSPSMQFKGDLGNEDALSARDEGRFARLVVADSHYGHQASAHLVSMLHGADLATANPVLAETWPVEDGSESTVTCIWLDRERGSARVDWFGDSLALCLRRGSAPDLLVEPDHRFVTPGSFEWLDANYRQVAVEPGDLLVAFSDGVNECHYRRPDTSIGIGHIHDIFEATDNAQTFVQRLGQTALAGVDGNPGGQDNIAIAAVVV